MDKKSGKKTADEVSEMLRGVPPKNILVSFDNKPPKSLEEHIKDQQQRKPVRTGNSRNMTN